MLSSLLVTTISTERLALVTQPNKRPIISFQSTVILISLETIFSICVSLHTPFTIVYRQVGGVMMCYATNERLQLYVTYTLVVMLTIGNLFTGVAIFICSVYTCIILCHRRYELQRIYPYITESQKKMSSNAHMENKVTCMLLLITTTFLALRLPRAVTWLELHQNESKWNDEKSRVLLLNILNKFSTVQCSWSAIQERAEESVSFPMLCPTKDKRKSKPIR